MQKSLELNRIDTEIKKLQEDRAKVAAQIEDTHGLILSELKKSKFTVYKETVWITPTDKLKAELPVCGSQDTFDIILTDGFNIYCWDYGFILKNKERDIIAPLKYLVSLGVPRSAIDVFNSGMGSVAFAEYELNEATKNRNKILKTINEIFT